MSLSDKHADDDSYSIWKPLVPTDLEKYDRESDSKPDLDDPEVAKAFQVLYERRGEGITKNFALLYGPRKEIDKDKREKEEKARREEEAERAAREETVDTGPSLEDIRQNAYEEGFAQGREDGFRAGLEAAKEKTERLAAVLTDVEGMWSRIVRSYEEKIIQLVGRVAEKVVYGKVAVDNEIITRAIMNAFEHIADPVHAVITVNPEDYEYIEVVKEDFFEKIKGLKQVTIVSDPLINAGGCRIETPSGEVATDIEERLEAVKRCIIETSR